MARTKKKIEYDTLTEELRNHVEKNILGSFVRYEEVIRGEYGIFDSFGNRLVVYAKRSWTSERGAKTSLANHIMYTHHGHQLVQAVMGPGYYLSHGKNWRQTRKELYQFVEELVEKGIVRIQQL